MSWLSDLFGGGKPKVDTSFQDFSIKESKRVRKEEERQARIDAGMKQIETIFEGGTTTKRAHAGKLKYNPKETYYTPSGKVWSPKKAASPPSAKKEREAKRAATAPTRVWDWNLNGGLGGYRPIQGRAPVRATAGPKAPAAGTDNAAQQFEKARKNLRVMVPGEKQAGLDPLLDARKTAMEGFYYPQLDKEFETSSDDLTFALSRAGLGTSSVAKKRRADLGQGFDLERASIGADIERDLASTETDYGQVRREIEAGLRASGDATAAGNAALGARTTFAKDQPELSPIGHVFAGFAEGIGQARNGYDIGRINRAIRGGGSLNRDTSKVVG